MDLALATNKMLLELGLQIGFAFGSICVTEPSLLDQTVKNTLPKGLPWQHTCKDAKEEVKKITSRMVAIQKSNKNLPIEQVLLKAAKLNQDPIATYKNYPYPSAGLTLVSIAHSGYHGIKNSMWTLFEKFKFLVTDKRKKPQ